MEVKTLKYWYDFGITEPELEIVEKQALIIAPNTVVTAHGEGWSIEVIEEKDADGIVLNWRTVTNITFYPNEIVTETDFASLMELSVAEMFRRFAAISTKKA
ncbi:hypothetical protein OK414_02005 [Priestia sp. JV24]|uniref:hypothetical protein n=1 Tax=Priestia TaxID=2800373 RepID=UPI0021D66E9F|nr:MULTISPECIES: hypothetical protein [Priestia]MCU7712615.1 hypothetical protein [Priestia megaterium]MCW1043819.1 hypothetical protein [Priestia sp. JV24]